MIQIKKTILTLVALIAVTTGAWAEELSESFTTTNRVLVYTGEHFKITVDKEGDGSGFVLSQAPSWNATIEALNGETITKVEFTRGWYDITRFSCEVGTTTFSGDVATVSGVNQTSLTVSATNYLQIEAVKVYYTEGSSASTFDVDWNAASKTGTFDMPGGNVELEPEYYPQATAAEGAVTEATDVKATTDAPLVTIDKTKLTGAAKMMYYVSTEATAPAYDAEGWTDELPTAEKFTEAGNVNVWYYPVGTDEGVGGATATYSDGDMNAKALAVTIAAAPTYAVTFKAANANTIESGKATVTVGGTDKTSAITEGKLEGVKMGSEVKLEAKPGYKFRKVEVKKGAADVKITSFSIHTSSNYVYSAGTFTCSIIDILPANATNQTFEWNINSGAPVGTAIKTVSDDTKTVTIQAGAVSGSITIEATAKDGGGANKLMHITVME